MKLVYFGKGVRGESCLRALLDRGEKVLAVVIEPGETFALAEMARANEIPVLQPASPNAEDFVDSIRDLGPDLFVLAGYSKILKKRVIDVPKQGAINLHGGKLPEYRGVAPINWQIINGETTGGCCILYVDEGIDTGAILAQEHYAIFPEDDAGTVLTKTLEIFPKLLLRVLDELKAGTAKPVPQNRNEGCYYTRRRPEDGQIDWNATTAEQVHNLVRALTKPYPGAFTFLNGQKIYLRKTSLIERTIRGVPGRIPLKDSQGMVVLAKDRGLMIEKVSLGETDDAVEAATVLRIGDTLASAALRDGDTR